MTPLAGYPETHAWEGVLDVLADAIDTPDLPAVDRGHLAWLYDQAQRRCGIDFGDDHPLVPDFTACAATGNSHRSTLSEREQERRARSAAAQARAKEPGGLYHLPLDGGAVPVRLNLLRAGIATIAELEQMTDEQLLAIDGVGPASVKLIRRMLAAHRDGTATTAGDRSLGRLQLHEHWRRTKESDGIDQLGLEGATQLILVRAGLLTLDVVRTATDAELLALPRLGAKRLAEIRRALDALPARSVAR